MDDHFIGFNASSSESRFLTDETTTVREMRLNNKITEIF